MDLQGQNKLRKKSKKQKLGEKRKYKDMKKEKKIEKTKIGRIKGKIKIGRKGKITKWKEKERKKTWD